MVKINDVCGKKDLEIIIGDESDFGKRSSSPRRTTTIHNIIN